MKAALFLGGPWNGKRMTVEENRRTVEVPALAAEKMLRTACNEPAPATFDVTTYQGEALRDANGRQFIVYATADVRQAGIIATLLDGYRP